MISVILFEMDKNNDFLLSFFQIVGAWQDFTDATKLITNFLSVHMVLGDAFSKLETFVWILNSIPRSITWSLFTLEASYLVIQMTNLNMIFHVVVPVYRLVEIWNSPQFPDEFRNGQLPTLTFITHTHSYNFCPVSKGGAQV